MSTSSRGQPCRVVLVGMMGSGKTTVGWLLAEATGWPRYDNDTLLDELYGMTAKQLLEARGEDGLRDAEGVALVRALEAEPPCLIDAAAGTILSESTRRALLTPLVVWLRARPEALFRRAFGGDHRPWLEKGVGWLQAAESERRPLYASVADVVVDTDDRSPTDIADEVLAQLRVLCPAAFTTDGGGTT